MVRDVRRCYTNSAPTNNTVLRQSRSVRCHSPHESALPKQVTSTKAVYTKHRLRTCPLNMRRIPTVPPHSHQMSYSTAPLGQYPATKWARQLPLGPAQSHQLGQIPVLLGLHLPTKWAFECMATKWAERSPRAYKDRSSHQHAWKLPHWACKQPPKTLPHWVHT